MLQSLSVLEEVWSIRLDNGRDYKALQLQFTDD
jgi:hypothetical protein